MFRKIKNIYVKGDNREILKLIPDNSFDLVLTSPPYNFKITKKQIKMDNDFFKSNEEYLKFIETSFSEAIRVLKPGGYFIYIIMDNIFCNFYTSGEINKILEQKGLIFKNESLWIKIKRNKKIIEKIEVFQKPPNDYKIIWPEIYGFYNKDQYYGALHPGYHTPKIYEALIKKFTKKGDIILDPFAGTGSVGIAAVSLKRYFFLIESNKKSFSLLRERLKRYKQF